MQPTATQIQHHIHTLRAQTITLEALATRHIRPPQTRTRRRTNPAYATTPINLTAADTLDQMHALATTLTKAAHLHHSPHTGVHQLLQGLDRPPPCQTLATRDDAWHILRLTTQAQQAIDHITNPDPAHRYIGRCDHCGHPIWIAETKPAQGNHQCDTCGHTTNLATIAQTTRARLLISGYTGTAAELSHTLQACGIPTRRNTITQWAKRGRITPINNDENGQPLYALADVVVLSGVLEEWKGGVA